MSGLELVWTTSQSLSEMIGVTIEKTATTFLRDRINAESDPIYQSIIVF